MTKRMIYTVQRPSPPLSQVSGIGQVGMHPSRPHDGAINFHLKRRGVYVYEGTGTRLFDQPSRVYGLHFIFKNHVPTSRRIDPLVANFEDGVYFTLKFFFFFFFPPALTWQNNLPLNKLCAEEQPARSRRDSRKKLSMVHLGGRYFFGGMQP